MQNEKDNRRKNEDGIKKFFGGRKKQQQSQRQQQPTLEEPHETVKAAEVSVQGQRSGALEQQH